MFVQVYAFLSILAISFAKMGANLGSLPRLRSSIRIDLMRVRARLATIARVFLEVDTDLRLHRCLSGCIDRHRDVRVREKGT